MRQLYFDRASPCRGRTHQQRQNTRPMRCPNRTGTGCAAAPSRSSPHRTVLCRSSCKQLLQSEADVNSGSATVPLNILGAVDAPIRNDRNLHRHFYGSARPLSIENRDSNGACAHQVHSHRISSQLAGPSWWRCERRLRQRQVGKTGGGNRTGGRAQKVTVHARPAVNNHSSGMRSRTHILRWVGLVRRVG